MTRFLVDANVLLRDQRFAGLPAPDLAMWIRTAAWTVESDREEFALSEVANLCPELMPLEVVARRLVARGLWAYSPDYECYQVLLVGFSPPDSVSNATGKETFHSITGARRTPVNPKVRKAIFEQDQYACRFCGATGDLTIDHIRPVSRGGTNTPTNLQTLCRTCNTRKGDTWVG